MRLNSASTSAKACGTTSSTVLQRISCTCRSRPCSRVSVFRVATILRKIARDERPPPAGSDRVARALYAFRLAIVGLENEILATDWMQLPRAEFGGLRPLDVLDSQLVYGRIRDLLTPIIYGNSTLGCIRSPGTVRLLPYRRPERERRRAGRPALEPAWHARRVYVCQRVNRTARSTRAHGWLDAVSGYSLVMLELQHAAYDRAFIPTLPEGR